MLGDYCDLPQPWTLYSSYLSPELPKTAKIPEILVVIVIFIIPNKLNITFGEQFLVRVIFDYTFEYA